MKKKATNCLLWLLLCPLILLGQTINNPNQVEYQLKISKATQPIKVDGVLDEAEWHTADVASNFWQKSPRDNVRSVIRTEAKVTYDDNFLYVAGICYDGANHIIPTLKRDEFWDGDGFAVVLDPLNEASTGFMFGSNPYGVQTEVLLGGGSGSSNYNGNWDNRWFVESKRHVDHWVVEMAIPFKTLRYDAGRLEWGINFIRNDVKNNRLDAWAPVPLQFWVIDLGYTGLLNWDLSPSKSRSNINLIPYINGSSSKDFAASTPTENSTDIGIDAKVAITPSLNLDLTINPDFSQVEVDQQVTNLTRFSIFLPERRTFFLENSDIFTRVGYPTIQPFFSRRVGLDPNGRAIPIQYGARLTGNATATTRIGILNVQTKATEAQLSQNYTAAAISQRVFKRSRLQGLFVNRQAYEDGETSKTDYGRNLSLKFNYLSEDGSFEFWSGAHRSFKAGIQSENHFFENGVSYSGKNLSVLFNHVYLGTNYYADVGFLDRINNFDASTNSIVRLGYNWFILPISYRVIPENSKALNQYSFNLDASLYLDPQGTFLESNNAFTTQFEYKNSSELSFGIEHIDTDLRFPFIFSDIEPIPAGRYQYIQGGIEYNSDERKLFQYQISARGGGFYLGNLLSAELTLLYRTQPWGNFGITVEYNHLSFPEDYGQTTLWAFSPRVEISFHRNLFWTTFVQYNTQLDNLNINSRFQWRFSPMSDVFIVYTDNYFVESFQPRSKALVFKVNYWLAL